MAELGQTIVRQPKRSRTSSFAPDGPADGSDQIMVGLLVMASREEVPC